MTINQDLQLRNNTLKFRPKVLFNLLNRDTVNGRLVAHSQLAEYVLLDQCLQEESREVTLSSL